MTEESCPREREKLRARDPLGRAHQLRVDIAVALSLVPAWVRRALSDRNAEKARSARLEIVERIAVSLERRFRITWIGSDDTDAGARAPDHPGPLFGTSGTGVETQEIPAENVEPVDSKAPSGGT